MDLTKTSTLFDLALVADDLQSSSTAACGPGLFAQAGCADAVVDAFELRHPLDSLGSQLDIRGFSYTDAANQEQLRTGGPTFRELALGVGETVAIQVLNSPEADASEILYVLSETTPVKIVASKRAVPRL